MLEVIVAGGKQGLACETNSDSELHYGTCLINANLPAMYCTIIGQNLAWVKLLSLQLSKLLPTVNSEKALSCRADIIVTVTTDNPEVTAAQ